MRERFIIGLAAGVLMAAMLPGITLGATVGGPGVAGGGASAEAGASSVEPAKKHFRGKNKNNKNNKNNKAPMCRVGCSPGFSSLQSSALFIDVNIVD